MYSESLWARFTNRKAQRKNMSAKCVPSASQSASLISAPFTKPDPHPAIIEGDAPTSQSARDSHP